VGSRDIRHMRRNPGSMYIDHPAARLAGHEVR
jgi:hypothetical protein